ncbi:MAG: outer membrane beta-barrel protein [Pseudomonadota bacterium]
MTLTIKLGATALALVLAAGTATAQSFDWTGFSGGLQIGTIDVDTDGPDLSGNDESFGARAYYDVDYGDFVVGGGIQYDETDVDLDGAATIDSVLRIGGRAGYDLDRNWIYAAAGYAQAMTDAGSVDVGDSGGFYLGVGYEVFLTNEITAGAELLYHQFEDFDVDGLEADATTFSLSVNYRF